MQGSATNQDGRSSSLTAPNGPAQQALILAAAQACRDSISAISLLATHGTGTPLGDPIETGAIGAAVAKLQPVYRNQGWNSGLTLSSVKATYGHTEGTAGQIPFHSLHFVLYGSHVEDSRSGLHWFSNLTPFIQLFLAKLICGDTNS